MGSYLNLADLIGLEFRGAVVMDESNASHELKALNARKIRNVKKINQFWEPQYCLWYFPPSNKTHFKCD